MTSAINHAIWPGFDQPVAQSQTNFRSLLAALSEPGTVHELAGPQPVGDLCPAAWHLLLTMCDQDTPLWISPGLEQPALETNIRFHCGSPLTRLSGEADFALLTLDEWTESTEFCRGTDECPHTSTTLIVQIPEIATGPLYRLSGPGIRQHRDVRLSDLTADQLAALSANKASFPRGLDVFFVSGSAVIALSRTTEIQMLKEDSPCT